MVKQGRLARLFDEELMLLAARRRYPKGSVEHIRLTNSIEQTREMVHAVRVQRAEAIEQDPRLAYLEGE